jgi:signal transduction histidine kinase
MAAFLGTANHEFRGPLTTCKLSVQLAAQRLDLLRQQMVHQDAALADQVAAVQDRLTVAESSLERLTRLVSDLFDVSRLQSGQLGLHAARTELRAIVRAAVDQVRQLAPTRCIRLHLPARREAPVWADADRLYQVVINYLTNALKYSAADRPVDVRVQVRAGWVRISVRDQGPGLSSTEQSHIWEPFHRAAGVEVATDAPHGFAQSLGLGLYICKIIMEQHQGEVGVRSAPGGGSTFWFALPVLPTVRLALDEPPPASLSARPTQCGQPVMTRRSA